MNTGVILHALLFAVLFVLARRIQGIGFLGSVIVSWVGTAMVFWFLFCVKVALSS